MFHCFFCCNSLLTCRRATLPLLKMAFITLPQPLIFPLDRPIIPPVSPQYCARRSQVQAHAYCGQHAQHYQNRLHPRPFPELSLQSRPFALTMPDTIWPPGSRLIVPSAKLRPGGLLVPLAQSLCSLWQISLDNGPAGALESLLTQPARRIRTKDKGHWGRRAACAPRCRPAERLEVKPWPQVLTARLTSAKSDCSFEPYIVIIVSTFDGGFVKGNLYKKYNAARKPLFIQRLQHKKYL